MKAIAVQLDIAWEDKGANYASVRRLLAHSEVERGGLIVLPEMFSTGFSMNVEGIHEGEPSETAAFLAEIAVEHGAYVVGGLVRRGSGGLGRNEAAVFGPDGGEIARYCKMHPFTFGGETRHYEPGESVVTFACGEFTAAPFICYDLRFPEIFRHAVVRGANLMVVIACWPNRREAHWIKLLQARAIENQAYVVGVNRCGKDPKLEYSGHSMIVDPRGDPIVDAGMAEAVVAAELDLASLESYRAEFPALADIRGEYRGTR